MLGQWDRFHYICRYFSGNVSLPVLPVLVKKARVCYYYYFERLLEEFENHIEELKQLDEKIQRRVEKLEHQCQREAKEFAHKVQDLYRSNQVCLVLN